MRGMLRVTGFVMAGVVAVAAVFVGSTLPPAAEQTVAGRPVTHLYGAYHVHTTRSDGTGTVEDVAAAAGRAGLQFVILTDHGTGTRRPDPPAYYGDVLVIDAVELATTAGHVVALGIGAAPYPFRGRPGDVIDDIHRLGGIAIVAHPNSPKPELQWRDWNTSYDGLEWVNADSEWRDEPAGRLVASALRLLVRPAETVVSLFGRPVRTLRRWDDSRRRRAVVGLAAVDAHGGVASNGREDGSGGALALGPGYEQMFRAVVQVVEFSAPPTGDASADAAELIGGIASGHTYSVTRGLATPATLEVVVRQGGETYGLGASIEPGIETEVHVGVAGVPRARLVLLEDGRPIAEGRGSLIHTLTPREGSVVRVEAYHPSSAFPWIMSSPFHAGRSDPAGREAAAVAFDGPVQPLPASDPWVVEHDDTSTGDIRILEDEIRFIFAIGGQQSNSPYAALALPIDSDQGFDRVALTIRADRPMRVSVQVRLPGPGGGQRWGRSVYVDHTPKSFVLPFRGLAPLDAPSGQQPIEATVRGVLFVIDTVNADPGSTGTIWLSGLGLGPASAPNRD